VRGPSNEWSAVGEGEGGIAAASASVCLSLAAGVRWGCGVR
jgi:hypothetical protein